MIKKYIVISSLIIALAVALPVLAEETGVKASVGGKIETSTGNRLENKLENRVEKKLENPNGERKAETAGLRGDASLTSTQIACVGAAVAVRESSLGTAVSAQASALQNAYGARATALATAYAKTSTTEVRTGVRIAWTNFRTAVKAGQRAWTTSRNDAWNKFKTAARACKAPSSISDSANVSLEVSGQ